MINKKSHIAKDRILSILHGVLVWIFGLSFYLGSFYIPILENPEKQANLVLSITLIPSAMLGTYLFYIRGKMASVWLANTFVSTAIILDALITVPVFVIPAGGSYDEFFSSMSFYLIALEYFIVVLTYGWYLNLNGRKQKTQVS